MPDLDTIKKQAEAATPEPWHRSCGTVNTEDGGLIASLAYARRGERKANAEFIAAARTNVPMLVTAPEEAQALLQRWRYAEGGAEQERLFEETMVALGESG
jgi:hypothetical protein